YRRPVPGVCTGCVPPGWDTPGTSPRYTPMDTPPDLRGQRLVQAARPLPLRAGFASAERLQRGRGCPACRWVASRPDVGQILVQTVGHYGTRQRTRTDPARGDCSEDLAGRPRHRRGLQPHQPGPPGPRRRPPRGEREVSRRRRIEFDAGDGGFGAALGELLA